MPALELHYVDGTVETRELSRTQPLTIGKQSFNDICVANDDVAAMHCRVLWNKSSFEVTAATANGVEVNGTSVSQIRLRPGDVIRVGSLDLVYIDQAISPSVEDSSLVFQAIDPASTSKSPAKAKPAASADRPVKGADAVSSRPVEEMSVFEGPVYTESQAIAAYDPDEATSRSAGPVGKSGRDPGSPSKAESHSNPRRPSDRPAESGGRGLQTRARPGEQDILRSPLVLGLSVAGIVLVLVTGVFWFLIGREQASRLYDRAVAELNEGQYAQSIASFEQFLQQYSGHNLHRQAERGLDRALVQREISGATPAWKRGLEQLQTLISHHRNQPDFADLHPQIHRYAEEISLGAARAAEASRDPDLLTVSEDAQVVLERFADSNAPPTAAIARIKEARVAAVIAIGKQKFFDDGIAAVEAGLAAKKPMVALAEREKLVRAFDGFASHKRVKEALQKALDLERSVIVSDDRERPAETTDVPMPPQLATLGLFHTRTRTDETSQGTVAFVIAKDCCYAVDAVTGELIWRRAIGFDVPFFPVLVSGSQSGVLLYDSNLQSLVCCQPQSGRLIWRQKLEARPRSAPLVHEGQIYLPTNDRSLCRIDVETGRLTERITFSQNIQGPPTLTQDGNHLLVPGEAAMIYSLSMRPLAAAAMTFTDHAAGSIQAPPMSLGKLYLLCENDKSDSAALRLWDASQPKTTLVELTSKALRVRGQVREPGVVRGNQLVVPSSGEQLAAFSVSDEAGREGLAPIGQYRVEEIDDQTRKQDPAAVPDAIVEPSGRRIPLYVALGPDRQFWTASSAFRRLEIGADSIHMDSKSVAPGIASQKLQAIGDQFFVGRKAIFNDAVTFSAVDRDRMVIPWRTVLGSQLLQLIPGRSGGAVGLSEAGQILVLSPDRLRQGGIDLKAAVELELPPGIQRPLVTSQLHDGRSFLAAHGGATQLWVIGPGGQLDFNTKLAKADIIQAGAALLDEGLVVPISGRLKVISLTPGRKSIQDWLIPVDGKAPPVCRFLARLDGDEVLAGFQDGLLARIQVRTTDVPHLAEAAKLQLTDPIDIPPVVRGDNVLVADVAGNVQLYNWRTFDREGKRLFPAPVQGIWLLDSSWLVWAGDGKVHRCNEGRDLPVQWSYDLKDLTPAGAPVQDGNFIWLACRDGHVIGLNSQTGAEVRRVRTPQSLTMGLKKLDDRWFAIACDGTLYPIDLTEQ